MFRISCRPAYWAQGPPVRLETEWVETLCVMELVFTPRLTALSELWDLCLPLPLWSFPATAGTDTLFWGVSFTLSPDLPYSVQVNRADCGMCAMSITRGPPVVPKPLASETKMKQSDEKDNGQIAQRSQSDCLK